jgi:hypothetical protein
MVRCASCARLIRFDDAVVDRVVDRSPLVGTVAVLDRRLRSAAVAR